MITTTIFKQAAWTLLLTVLYTFTASAGTQAEKRKEMNRSFPAQKGDILKIDNRFGNITLEHWNKNEVEIRVVIESKSNQEQTATENLNKVSIQMDKNGNTISAVTTIKQTQNNNNNNELKVNYTIITPDHLSIDLKQEFGNIVLADKHEGDCNLLIKFGNISSGNIKGALKLNSQFSNVSLGNLTTAWFDLRHSGKVTFQQADNVDVDMQFSNLETGTLNTLKLNERHSNATVGSIKNGIVNVQHSDLKIGGMNQKLDVESLSHSNLEIKELLRSFKGLTINSSFSSVKIYTVPQIKFSINADASFGDIKIEKNFKQNNANLTEKSNKKSLEADINGGGSPIEFNGNFSTISIKEL